MMPEYPRGWRGRFWKPRGRESGAWVQILPPAPTMPVYSNGIEGSLRNCILEVQILSPVPKVILLVRHDIKPQTNPGPVWVSNWIYISRQALKVGKTITAPHMEHLEGQLHKEGCEIHRGFVWLKLHTWCIFYVPVAQSVEHVTLSR